MILSQFVAVVSAFTLSIRYGYVLGIRVREWNRYLKKSVSLGLCYAGFGSPRQMRQAWKAGEAGFLCCAYDVVTDWRHFEPGARKSFEGIMQSMQMAVDLQSLAMNLYEKEISDSLTDDGLDRGSIALRFTLRVMGCEKAREVAWGDVDEVGRLFQIVDDVLDYEQDVIAGDVNCLTSSKRDDYLRQLIERFGSHEVDRLFGPARSALIIAIERARAKAEVLLAARDVHQETAGFSLPLTARASGSVS